MVDEKKVNHPRRKRRGFQPKDFMKKALSVERKAREKTAQEARQAMVKASEALSELQTHDRALAERHTAAMADPAANWQELRDVEDELRFLKIAIRAAEQARMDEQRAVFRAELREQDAPGIRNAANLAVKLDR